MRVYTFVYKSSTMELSELSTHVYVWVNSRQSNVELGILYTILIYKFGTITSMQNSCTRTHTYIRITHVAAIDEIHIMSEK